MAQPAPTTSPSAAVPTTPAQTTRATTPVPTTPPVAATTAPTTSSPAPVVVPSSSSIAPIVSSSLPAVQSSTSALPSFSTTSLPPSSTSTLAPTTSSTPTAVTSSSSSTVLTITSTLPRPSLITSVNPSSRSSAAAAASGTSEGKGGVAGSGLSVGAFTGIIIGGLAGIALIAFLVTHSMRKKARSRRTANRSSMFEPWPAPAPVALEDEPYEKSRFDPPSQSYAMQDQSYDPYVNAQQQAYHAEAQPLAYGHGPQVYDQAESYNYSPEYAARYGQYPPATGYAGAAGVGAAAVAGGMAMGHDQQGQPGQLMDGMMVRVKVGFVRTLEDELAITPGQQLYLHNQYDDGWSLCEDQNQNRGVVPVSCLEPWVEGAEQPGMNRSNTAESLGAAMAGRRRSSLYQVQNQVGGQGQYLGQ